MEILYFYIIGNIDEFICSGHGGRVRDKDGDEADRNDETIVPIDYQKNGEITDDVMIEFSNF
jgi:hypothetical protein